MNNNDIIKEMIKKLQNSDFFYKRVSKILG